MEDYSYLGAWPQVATHISKVLAEIYEIQPRLKNLQKFHEKFEGVFRKKVGKKSNFEE